MLGRCVEKGKWGDGTPKQMLGGAGDWGALGKWEENMEKGGREELGLWEERSLGGHAALGLQS